jgi:hypothetical protein
MRSVRLLLATALAFWAGATPAQLPPPTFDAFSAGHPLHVDARLRAAAPGERLRAVLTFDRYPGAADLDALRAARLQTHAYAALPMIAVQGSRRQIERMPMLSGLRAIHLDRSVPYADEAGAVRGAPGTTIAVIDAGLDARRAALPAGTQVLQNVRLAPDPFGAGPFLVEGLANTDTAGGRGTRAAAAAAAGGASLVGVGLGDAPSLLSALAAYDWVLRHRLDYRIGAIATRWADAGGEPDVRDPLVVAGRLARAGGGR